MSATQPTAVAVTTPEGIAHIRLVAIAIGLAFKVNTGMEVTRVSALSTARNSGLTTKRTAKGALADVVAVIRSYDPEWTKASVEEALAK